MKISKLYGLALAATMLVASIARAETLTLSTPDADNSEITLSANKFAELVSKKTDGKLKIKVFPNGTLYGGDPSAQAPVHAAFPDRDVYMTECSGGDCAGR